MRNAHHRRQHEQCVTKAGLVRSARVAGVVRVHEDVGAGLQLVPHARGLLEPPRAAARPRHDRHGETGALHGELRLQHPLAGGDDGRRPFGVRAQVLRGAVIAVEAGEAQRREAARRPRPAAPPPRARPRSGPRRRPPRRTRRSRVPSAAAASLAACAPSATVDQQPMRASRAATARRASFAGCTTSLVSSTSRPPPRRTRSPRRSSGSRCRRRRGRSAPWRCPGTCATWRGAAAAGRTTRRPSAIVSRLRFEGGRSTHERRGLDRVERVAGAGGRVARRPKVGSDSAFRRARNVRRGARLVSPFPNGAADPIEFVVAGRVRLRRRRAGRRPRARPRAAASCPRARQRVGAVVVDPVEHRHAVLDRVAEGGLVDVGARACATAASGAASPRSRT